MIGDTLRRVRFAPILTATVLTILLLLLVRSVATVLVLLLLGILISLYLRALTDQLERRLRLPDPFSYIAALVLTIASVTALIWILVPPVIEQTQQLFTVLPNYIAGWETGLENVLLKYPGLRDVVGTGDHRILRAVYERLAGSFGDVVPRMLGLVHGAFLSPDIVPAAAANAQQVIREVDAVLQRDGAVDRAVRSGIDVEPRPGCRRHDRVERAPGAALRQKFSARVCERLLRWR
mgnify:CR=1 FL=1